MEFFALVVAVFLGYVIGLMQNGINIHKHAVEEEPVKYNKSINLNDDVKNYYEQNDGMNKF